MHSIGRHSHAAVRARALCALAVAAALALAAAGTSAAATWSVQTGARTPTGFLVGVSCATATSCVAVGSTNFAPVAAIAESWNGTSWSATTTAVPTGATITDLLAVSCASERFCVAVGYSRVEATGEATAMAQSWDGSRWTLMTLPSPRGWPLRAVSCSSERGCTATSESHILRWNGTEWRSQTNLGEAPAGVSCTSETFCMSVGTAVNELFRFVPAASRWDGTSWRSTTVTAPEGAETLNSVSCSSSTFCMSFGSRELSEQWNGSSWRQGTSPVATFAGTNQLSCVSERMCMAASSAVAAQWNGTSWTTERLPLPEGATANGGRAVSCTSATACTLVGFYNERGGSAVPLIERYS